MLVEYVYVEIIFQKNISWMALTIKWEEALDPFYYCRSRIPNKRKWNIIHVIIILFGGCNGILYTLPLYIHALFAPRSLFLTHSLSLHIIPSKGDCHEFLTGEQWTLPKLQVPKISVSIVSGSHGVF